MYVVSSLLGVSDRRLLRPQGEDQTSSKSTFQPEARKPRPQFLSDVFRFCAVSQTIPELFPLSSVSIVSQLQKVTKNKVSSENKMLKLHTSEYESQFKGLACTHITAASAHDHASDSTCNAGCIRGLLFWHKFSLSIATVSCT